MGMIDDTAFDWKSFNQTMTCMHKTSIRSMVPNAKTRTKPSSSASTNFHTLLPLGYCPLRGRIPTHRPLSRPHPQSHEPDSWEEARCRGCPGRMESALRPLPWVFFLCKLHLALPTLGFDLSSFTYPEHIHYTYIRRPPRSPRATGQPGSRPAESIGTGAFQPAQSAATEPRWMVVAGGI